MSDSTPLVQFPVPTTSTLVLLGIGFTALLFAAVGHEVFQRRQGIRARRASEWRSIRMILKERGIDRDGAALLERLIKRYSSLEPLRVVTTRDGFEHCVESEMGALQAKGEADALDALGLRLRDLRVELGLDYVPVGQQIHSTRELHEGQWISISKIGEERAQWSRVMVEAVQEAHFFVSLKETSGPDAPDFSRGTKLRCRMWREEDARYLFDTEISASDPNEPTCRLRHTNELTRTQAREYFRVRHDQPVTVGIANAPIEGSEEGSGPRPTVTRLQGRVTSLSAGGCAIVVKQPVARQVLLRIPIKLPEGLAVETEGKIVASASISGGRYLVRIRFVGLSEEESDRLAKHVVHKQQQRLAEREQPE